MDPQLLAPTFFNNFQGQPLELLNDKDYRRDWAQEQARKKLRELRGSGLSYVEIGARLGVTGVFIGNILRKEDPKPVSKKVWDALIDKEGLQPVPPGSEPKTPLTEKVAASEPPTAREERMLGIIENLTIANRELGAEVKTLRVRFDAFLDLVEKRLENAERSGRRSDS